MKFLRVIRFDTSDEHVFAAAATPGEWAVSGGFEFADLDESALSGKIRQAFANGFLGVPSFGRSTFATIVEIREEEHAELIASLAHHFVVRYGAPDEDAARSAATDEAAFIEALCEAKPINTVFTIRRAMDETGVREEFREITPPQSPAHSRIWDVVDDPEGDAPPAQDNSPVKNDA